MSQRPAQKSKYVSVGSMVVDKEPDQNGKPAYYIKVNPKTKVTVDGVEVKFIQVQRPTDKLDRMLSLGAIDQATYDNEASEFAEGGKKNFIKFELSAKVQ